MELTMKICVLPGDGIGPEIVAEAVRVLKALDLKFEMEEALLGGCAVDATGKPYPEATQKLAREADAVLLGLLKKGLNHMAQQLGQQDGLDLRLAGAKEVPEPAYHIGCPHRLPLNTMNRGLKLLSGFAPGDQLGAGAGIGVQGGEGLIEFVGEGACHFTGSGQMQALT